MRGSRLKAAVTAGLMAIAALTSPAIAQNDSVDTEFVKKINAIRDAPRAPNHRPMEGIWDRAPEAPDDSFNDARPFFLSRWGGIVVRGKGNGDRIDKSLAAKHCGDSDNPATDIVFLGVAPPNICDGVVAVPASETKIFDSPVTIKGFETTYQKYGTADGWVVIEFTQNVDDNVHYGRSPATGEFSSDWGVSSLGAFYRNEGGKHVFYAPGETVQLTKSFSFVVDPVVDEDELAARATAAAMRSFSDDPVLAKIGEKQPRPVPVVGLLLLFGVPLSIIAGIVWGVRRLLRGRRIAAQRTGALPAGPGTLQPAKASPEMGQQGGAGEIDRDADNRPPHPGNIPGPIPWPIKVSLWWQRQSPRTRVLIVGGLAAVVVLAMLSTPRGGQDPTATLRSAYTNHRSGSDNSPLASGVGETTLAGELPNGPLVSPAPGHIARFHWFDGERSAGANQPTGDRTTFDTFATIADADRALADIKAHGPQEVLLLPQGGGVADNSLTVSLSKAGQQALAFECRNAPPYLYCMTRPDGMALLLSVRVPTHDGFIDEALPHAQTEALRAIDMLRQAGLGQNPG